MAAINLHFFHPVNRLPAISPPRCPPFSFSGHLHKQFSRKPLQHFPKTITTTTNIVPLRPTNLLLARSQFNFPIISPQDPWGTWSAIFAAAAFGLWSEKTKIGSALSGAIVSVLVGLVASNLGIIATDAPAYNVVLQFLMPLSVPLLLFRADMQRIVQSTGRLLIAFLVGSVATIAGTVVALLVVPMRSLGSDAWKIAAALMGRHIGGSVNYIAIADALGLSSSVLAAGLAADNVMCAVYFATLFALASKIPIEGSTPKTGTVVPEEAQSGDKLPTLQMAIALAVSFIVCKSGSYVTRYFGIQGGVLPLITAIVVVLASSFPNQFSYLAPAGESMATILMQIFFAVIGANGSIGNVMRTAPSIFLFSLVQIGVHLGVILGLGKLLQLDLKLLVLASNACVGGPTTASGMATAKGWPSLIIPGILAGIFGIAIATFLSIAFGRCVLRFI